MTNTVESGDKPDSDEESMAQGPGRQKTDTDRHTTHSRASRRSQSLESRPYSHYARSGLRSTREAADDSSVRTARRPGNVAGVIHSRNGAKHTPYTSRNVGPEMGIKTIEMENSSMIQTVEIFKQPGETLGFYIREGNGLDRNEGVFISRIQLGTVAERNGLLHVGDEIIAVNNVEVGKMSLDDVVILMSIPRKLMLKISSVKNCYKKNASCPSLAMTDQGTSSPPVVVVKKGHVRANSDTQLEMTEKIPDMYEHAYSTSAPQTDLDYLTKRFPRHDRPPQYASIFISPHKAEAKLITGDDVNDSENSSEGSLPRSTDSGSRDHYTGHRGYSSTLGLHEDPSSGPSVPPSMSPFPLPSSESMDREYRYLQSERKFVPTHQRSPSKGNTLQPYHSTTKSTPYYNMEIDRGAYSDPYQTMADVMGGYRAGYSDGMKRFQGGFREMIHSRAKYGGKAQQPRSRSPECYNSDSEIIYTHPRSQITADTRGFASDYETYAAAISDDEPIYAVPKIPASSSTELQQLLRRFNSLSHELQQEQTKLQKQLTTRDRPGMLHSGSGHTQVEKFMSTLEIQGLHHTSMKKRELEVEPHLENVCRESCKEALDEEIELQKKQVSPEESDVTTPVLGQFKYDMGWQKRGTGRAYDSKSGVGTMIGNLSGKVCGFGVRSKDCRKCSYHINKGQVPPDHKCSKNWDGSSKSMEPDVAAEVVMNIEQNENVHVGVLIMDDDTTTTSKLRETLNHHFVKWSDINHTRKHLGNSLYALQKKHKCLTTKVIQYIQKCFSYAVAQNKNDPKGLAKALNQIVPHAFGVHDNCNDSWCGYLINPEKYKHSSLPYGRNLAGEELRTDLCSIFEGFVKNVDKISPAASTKDVESMNNMIASKAPKRCHYSATSSLQNRVNCVVAEKNIGSAYVTHVNKSIGISPGKFYSKHAEYKDRKRQRRLEIENTVTFKRHRLERKMNKSIQRAQKELREGVTYQPSIDLIGNHDSDITEIPKPTSAPELKKIEATDNCSHVYCDIETTGLNKTCDITQIAAVTGEDCFNQYILPAQSITPGATQVTGLTVINNILCYKGKPVNAVSLKTALEQFLVWLEHKKPCLLIGHNFRIFDFPRLVRSFELCHLLSSFQNCVIGFVDTLPLCKEQYPGLDKYSQEYLVKTVMNVQYSAHNALEDVCSLQKLVSFTNVAFDKMCSHSITVDTAINTYMFEKKADVNLITLNPMQQEKVISKQMALKIARSGLSLAHLRLAVDRGGLDGIYKLFTEKVNGKVRVTSTNRIIESVFNFLCPNLDSNL